MPIFLRLPTFSYRFKKLKIQISNAQAIEEIGRRTTAVTGDPLETNHLFQRLSIAIQQTNAVSFTSTFKYE